MGFSTVDTFGIASAIRVTMVFLPTFGAFGLVSALGTQVSKLLALETAQWVGDI